MKSDFSSDSKKVSIIMGVYNCAKTLQTAIDSIRGQTYVNWELIICDDASTDETLLIAQKNADEDVRIIVLRNRKNMRLAATLNHCLMAATGDYIARMDGDDISSPTRLEKQVFFLNEHPDIACVGCNIQIMEYWNILECKKVRRFVEYPTQSSMVCVTPFSHPTIMMRKEVYTFLNGYKVSQRTARCEDLELWFRFFGNGFKGYNIQEPLYYYKETDEDYKKRSIRSGWNASLVSLQGVLKFSFSKWKLFLCFKPLVSALLPAKFMRFYHRMQDKASDA